MAQGKSFTKEEQNFIFEILKPYYMRGYSTKKAHISAFFELEKKFKDDIPEYSTITRWIKADKKLKIKKKAWQGTISDEAVDNWWNKIREGDYIASKEWLEKRDPKNFSTRWQLTGANGSNLFDPKEKKKASDLIDKVLK